MYDIYINIYVFIIQIIYIYIYIYKDVLYTISIQIYL